METTWKYLVNTFEAATRNNYTEAMKISTFHDSSLASMQKDAFFATLYKNYHQLHLNFKNCYDTWLTQEGKQTSKTLTLKQLLDQLSSTKIHYWDIIIQNEYDPNTPEYKALLPHHRKPFQQDKQLERIAAVKTLSNSLTGITALKKVKDDVDDFYKQLDEANTVQKSSKTETATGSQNVEAARIAICKAQYANLGALMQKYYDKPETIAVYFDVQTIRRNRQVTYTGHLKPLQLHNIAKHTFAADSQIKLNNLGTTELHFFLSQTKDSIQQTGITLKPAQQETYPATILGNIQYPYLMVYNTHQVENGHFEITIL